MNKWLKVILILFVFQLDTIAQRTIALGPFDTYIIKLAHPKVIKKVKKRCLVKEIKRYYLVKAQIDKVIHMGDSTVYKKQTELVKIEFFLIPEALLQVINNDVSMSLKVANTDDKSVLRVVSIGSAFYDENIVFTYPEGYFSGLINCTPRYRSNLSSGKKNKK